jgi:hypothetical protein
LADNGEKTLDADIAECMQDILRIRRRIANSKSGQVDTEPEFDIHSFQTPPAPAIIPVEPAQATEVVTVPADVSPQSGNPIPSGPEAATISGGPTHPENPYAVTSEEVAALLKVDSDVIEEPATGGNGEPVEIAAASETLSTVPTNLEQLVDNEGELESMVKEAEEWMEQVAPPETPAEPAVTIPAAVEVPETRQFDQVVSNLQGEQLIAPVDDEPVESPVADDFKLQIISGMKDEGLKNVEERGGIPKLDLEEASLGGTLESRRNAAATRKGPGRRREESAAQVSTEERTEIQETPVTAVSDIPAVIIEQSHTPAARRPQAMPRLGMPDDGGRLERQRRILAQIVARDIELLCGQGRRQRARVVWR